LSGEVSGQVPEETINSMPSMMAARTQIVQTAAMQAQIARHNAERLRRHQAVHASVTIMPPPATATLTAVGARVEVLSPGNVLRRYVAMPVETPAKVDPVPVVRWLDEIAFFIPKSIREPFVGDLREDLVTKAAKGHLRASIWWAAFSQVAIIAVRWAWSNLVRR
jgi:hypothetical protein